MDTMALMLNLEEIREQRQLYDQALKAVFLTILSLLKAFQSNERAIIKILSVEESISKGSII